MHTRKIIRFENLSDTYRTGFRDTKLLTNSVSIGRSRSLTTVGDRTSGSPSFVLIICTSRQAILSEDSILRHQKWLLKQHLPSQLETTHIQSLSRSIKLDEYTQKPTLSPSCCLSHPLCIHRLEPSASLSTVDRYESSVTQDQPILWRFNLR